LAAGLCLLSVTAGNLLPHLSTDPTKVLGISSDRAEDREDTGGEQLWGGLKSWLYMEVSKRNFPQLKYKINVS